MIDIRFLRENPEAVKENIRKKFQDAKLPLVDEVVDLDAKRRAAIAEVESLKAARNKLSKANGPLYGQLKKCDDEAKKAELQAQIDRNNAAVKADDDRRAELDQSVSQMDARIREIMYVIPNIIDPSVPIGPDDSCNVEVERFGDPVVPTFEIPHHVDIMASFNGIDKESAGRVAGMGFYYLLGDIARLHEAVLAYARDFMIDEKGFTYVIPPFMMHGDVVKGVMSFPEMEAASEVGVNLKNGYNGDLTSREAGSVGGQMVKNVCPIRTARFIRKDRTAVGHAVEVRYIAAVVV